MQQLFYQSNVLAQPIRPSKACAVILIYGLVLEMSSLPSIQNNKSTNYGPVKSIGLLDYTRITFKMLVPEGIWISSKRTA
jgi:hypothetical protein